MITKDNTSVRSAFLSSLANNTFFTKAALNKSEETQAIGNDDKIEDRLNRITQKMKAGKKLSAEELEFLKNNDYALYLKYIKILREREAFEEELKNAKTKQEAADIRNITMSGINKSSGDAEEKEIKSAQFSEAYKEFSDSKQFSQLPESDIELNKNNKIKKNKDNKENDKKTSDEDSIMNYTNKCKNEILNTQTNFNISV